MRYYKIYHQNARMHRAYSEITGAEFDRLVDDYAVENTPDIAEYKDEDGNIDYWRIDADMSSAVEQARSDAESEHGFNAGDYSLYIRDDDTDMYDIPREPR